MTRNKLLPLGLLGVVLLSEPASRAVAEADPPSSQSLVQQVRQLQTGVAALQAEVAALRVQLSNLQSPPASLNAIAPYVSLQTIDGNPTVRFTGANVQIVNGAGLTVAANGLGNLIVGYGEPRTNGPNSCSLGVFLDTTALDDQASCEGHGFTWALNHRTGSHYLVLGTGANYSQAGGIVGGVDGGSNNLFASAIAGFGNTASGTSSLVMAGQSNHTTGNSAAVVGGVANVASGGEASICGGGFNAAQGFTSVVGGGSSNTAAGNFASVSGGASNSAAGAASSVLGGLNQQAADAFQTIPALP